MSLSDGGQKLRGEELVNEPAHSVARTAIGLAVLSVLAAYFVVPAMMSEDTLSRIAASIDGPGIDMTTTASVPAPGSKKRYTIRRSVLQKTPNAPCIIYENGTREGDC